MKVGFIGLGLMGGAMSANLIKGGHSVCGYDISSAAVEKFVANGGKAASSPAEAAAGAEIVFSILPNSPHVESVVMGKDGLADSMRPGTIFADCSTILPDTTRRLGAFLKKRGIHMLDCAVGRTSTYAVLGKLVFMVGGDAADVETARPCLECMGESIVHCGELGSGIGLKLINNYMSTTLNVLTAEALLLVERLGIDRDMAIGVLCGTPAGKGHFKTSYPEKAFKGDLSPAFMLDMANKDLGLAFEMASSLKVPLFTGGGARQAYSVARAQGRGRQDWTAILPALEEMAKLKNEKE